MRDAAKVILSTGELAMAIDKNIILTKQAVSDKTFSLFSSLVPFITNVFKPLLSHNNILCAAIPKIYKGENYTEDY